LTFGSPFERKGVQRIDSDKGPSKHEERQAELRVLDMALQRESAFRARQAEATMRTQSEVEARLRIKQVEEEIYAERSE
jgi:hypothetical protein